MIHSAPQRNAATLRKVLAPFSVSHVTAIDSCSLFISEFLSLFFLCLDFIAISDCVFNNKNNCILGHTGYQIIITILVISSTPSLYANLRVATRVYDVEGGAIFSKNSTFVFFDGATWTPRLRSPSPIMAPGERRMLFSFPFFQQNTFFRASYSIFVIYPIQRANSKAFQD